MSNTEQGVLSSFSSALVALTNKTASGVVAVKSAAYRVVSGVRLHDDLIAVASHSLRREDRVPVQGWDGRTAVATILGREPAIDLAILKAEGLGGELLQAADPGQLKAGMLAAVVGMTVDVGPSTSLGMLGAVGGARRMWRGGTLDQFLRLDVNLYPSQAGAAVVDTEGKLIGMATPGLSRHSTIAVPVATIERLAAELLKEGRVRLGYLGVGMQPVGVPKNLREKLKQPQEAGLIILNVEPESPAERAGLQVGDILLRLGGTAITEIEELQAALRGDAVGATVKALVLRGGEPAEIDVMVTERGPKRK